MADDSEYRVDATVDETVYELGHKGFVVYLRFANPDVHAVGSHVDSVRVDLVVERPGCLTGYWIVLPAVPRADEPAIFDEAFSEWSALVRTSVHQRTPTVFGQRQRKCVVAGLHNGDFSNIDDVCVPNPKPSQFTFHDCFLSPVITP